MSIIHDVNGKILNQCIIKISREYSGHRAASLSFMISIHKSKPTILPLNFDTSWNLISLGIVNIPLTNLVNQLLLFKVLDMEIIGTLNILLVFCKEWRNRLGLDT